MKKIKLLGIVLFALTIVLAACPMEPPNTTTKKRQQQPFSITGKFNNGGKDLYFTAKKSTEGRSIGRAASATQEPLAGILDDGDITFRLKGFYDTESRAFTLSATSSSIKYSINGSSGGGATASVATRANATVPFGEPVIVEVDTTVTGTEAAANMISTGEEDLVSGLEEEDCFGVWYDEANRSFKYIVSDWGMAIMYKENGKWIDVGSLGFSKFTPKGGGFDVVADFTTIEWIPPRDPADFPAYLDEQDYQLVSRDVYENLPNILDHVSIFVILPDYDRHMGMIPVTTTNGIYGADVIYDTTGGWGGSVEKPFTLNIREPDVDGYYNLDEVAFAKIEDAVAKAETVIRYLSGDNTAEITLPEMYTTKTLKLSADIGNYRRTHPYPADMTNEADMRAWDIAFHTFLKGALNSCDSVAYPDADKIIFLGPEYLDMMTAWLEEDIPSFTKVTKYIKWNISLLGEKLTVKAYYSGTPETGYLDDPAYVKDNFAGADALTQSDPGAPTSMVR